MEVKLKPKLGKYGIKKRGGNPNQLKLRFKKPVVSATNVKEEIEKICRGVKGLLSVKIIMSGEKMVGVTITSCAGWKDKEFVRGIKTRIRKAIESKT